MCGWISSPVDTRKTVWRFLPEGFSRQKLNSWFLAASHHQHPRFDFPVDSRPWSISASVVELTNSIMVTVSLKYFYNFLSFIFSLSLFFPLLPASCVPFEIVHKSNFYSLFQWISTYSSLCPYISTCSHLQTPLCLKVTHHLQFWHHCWNLLHNQILYSCIACF